MQKKIDLERIRRGMKQIDVSGQPCPRDVPNAPERERAIEAALSAIADDPENALRKEFIGVKQYAHFGDQRCDCSYGRGPRHGVIKFSIGRVSGYTDALDGDAIYALECLRDYDPIDSYNLFQAIREMDDLKDSYERYERLLSECVVESHD